MYWAEIEQSAAEFRSYKQSLANQSLPASEKPRVDPLQIQSQKQAEIDEIFGKFRVRESLEALGREVFEEGEIGSDGTIFTGFFCEETFSLKTRLSLVSDPIHEIQISAMNGEPKPRLVITSSGVGLGVRVSPKTFQPDHWQLEVASYSIYNLDNTAPPLTESLRKHRLNRAFTDSLSLRSRKIEDNNSSFSRKIPLDSSTEGEFHLALADYVNKVRENNSLPKQVRAWCEERERQLPEDWPRGEWIDFDRLLEYAFQVRGTRKVVRDLHALTGYRFV
jgi:hypothetical protein